MELLRILLSRCTALFRRRALDEDLEDELHSHLDFATAENIESGMSETEARRAALRESSVGGRALDALHGVYRQEVLLPNHLETEFA